MSNRRRAAWLAAGALILVVLIVAVVSWRSSDSNIASSGNSTGTANGASSPSSIPASSPAPITSPFLRDVGAARAPFNGYTSGTLQVGDKTLTVVIADDDAERVQGLRGRSDAAPYDGMLFVWPSDTGSAFTMATVRGPLDIGFYDPAGNRVGALLMQPCPNGTDATCPSYQIDQPFRYALETAGGQLPAGALRRP